MTDFAQSGTHESWVVIDSCFIEHSKFFMVLKIFRDAYIGFRMGVSELSGHRFRYVKSDVVHLCPLCKEEEECVTFFAVLSSSL